MTKSEILASGRSPLEKVWEIARQRSDIGAANFGVLHDRERSVYERLGRCCCPIGAVLDGESSTARLDCDAAGLLGVTWQWVKSFTLGFDCTAEDVDVPSDMDGYAAGQEIRRRLEAMGVALG